VRQSTDRILSTHAGSLARPHSLLETMRTKEHGEAYDADAYAQQIREAVADVVRRQVDAGLDVVSDGEQGRVSFVSYAEERLDGLERVPGKSTMPSSWSREVADFPDYYAGYFKKYSSAVSPLHVAVCTGPVRYTGKDLLAADIANLQVALEASPAEEAFMAATSPWVFAHNEHYASDEEFMVAVAEALREEYLAIVDAGLLLQLDDPWLVEILSDESAEPAQRVRNAEAHVERVNYAVRDIPLDQIRFHTCYGLNHGPRVHDLPLSDVVDLMLRVNAGGYSFEVANPRHQHEWRVWEDAKLPEGRVLIPGFVSHATNFVEHPVLIADGIETYAKLVGRENVIAGVDCGFSSRASFAPEVDAQVVWAKFAALAEGAQIASERLWSRSGSRTVAV
jgi:5-methyltetrahydropteroyltriglutamate--homocysteine methyltransferase